MAYGMGLRVSEIINMKIKNIDLDRKQVHIVSAKGKKDRYVPLSDHLIRGIKRYISAEHPTTFLFTGNTKDAKGFDSRYSQRGVQWAVQSISKKAGILKDVHTHTLRHSYATHLLEDGVNILQVQKLMGHERVETTMEYLHVCQLEQQKVHSPLDTVFALCSRSGK